MRRKAGSIKRMAKLLMDHEPPGVGYEGMDRRSRFLVTCDHACNRFPERLGDLGVSAAERQRHIAWDIGALGVARRLAAALDAPLIYQQYSRLVIDANRDPTRADSIPLRSEATEIPGNKGLTPSARELRRREIFEPYHAAIRAELDARATRGVDTLYVSVHSFTPVYLGDVRRWQAGVLWRSDRAFAELLLAGLRRDPGLEIGDNQPYSLQSDVDYSVPEHADTRGLSNVLLEIRQDEITSEAQQADWAARLLPLLREADTTLHGCGASR